MVVGIDDHIVHKADAVSEEVPLVDGYLYQFDEHLDRFKTSADMAGLPLNMPEARLRRILLDTAAASLKMNGGCCATAENSSSGQVP
jgi:4-amino-4-deoxychorismate lyase